MSNIQYRIKNKKQETKKYSGAGSLSPLLRRGLGGGHWGEAL